MLSGSTWSAVCFVRKRRSPANLADFKAIPVSREVFYQVNTNPESGLKVTGTDDYVGLMDGPHQLHCVDILRRSNYYNMPHYRNGLYLANHTDEEVQWHIRECAA